MNIILFLTIFHMSFTKLELRMIVSPTGDHRKSLAKCTTDTAKQIFEKLNSVVIYCSRNLKNDDTVKNLSKEHLWTLLLMKIDPEMHQDLQNRHVRNSDYIINIQEENEFETIIEHILEDKKPRGKFLVTSGTTFTNPELIAEKILKFLWRENISEGYVLIRNQTNFNIYSWDPYINGKCGDKFTGVRNVGTCPFDSSTRLSKTLPKQFNRCFITVYFVNSPPSVINVQNNSLGFKEKYFNYLGMDVSIMNVIAERLNLTMKYTTTSFTPKWGEVYANGSATRDLKLLLEDNIDVVIGDYGITGSRLEFLDASTSFFLRSFAFCVPHVLESKHYNVTNVASWDVFLIGGGFCLFMSFVIWRWSNYSTQESSRYRKIVNVLLNCFAICLGLSVSVLPKSVFARYIISMLVIYSVITNVYYNSYLTSAMAQSNSRIKYASYSEIKKHKLKIFLIPNVDRYFQNDISVIKDWIPCQNLTECLEYIANRKDSAILWKRPYLEYITKDFSEHDLPLLYVQNTNIIANAPQGIFMRKGFPLYKKFDWIILQLISSGIIKKWTNQGTSFKDSRTNGDLKEPLKLSSIKSVFVVLFLGYFVAFIGLAIEIFGNDYIVLKCL